VTLSTVGLVPALERLAAEPLMPNLAVSLHATTDETRSRLVPINRRYPLEDLMTALRRFPLAKRRRITFEYVLLDGVNDSVAQARQLVKLLRNKPAKVNLIPFNAFPESEYRCSPQPAIDAFWQTLRNAGLIATVRRPRGDDIAAACGQLAGRVRDRQRVRLGDRVIGASNP
jgi:23S rRNA (adenine2503-C2)-methyltransferase